MSVDYNELKKGGFLKQRQKDLFIVRFRSLAGNLTSEQLRHLADLADRYGQGYVHVTTRQGAEIPWVNINDYNEMKKEIMERGLNTGTCGPRIRTVVACPGMEVCQFGLMNCRETAIKLDRAFFCREVPIKTKIGVSGCPNSCAKPQENDIGFVGAIEPELDENKCISCGLCERVCPNRAIQMAEGKPVIDKSRCLLEGNCIFSCPSDAWQEKRRGYLLYAGGKIGRKPRLGQVIDKFIKEEEVEVAVERVLRAFTTLRRDRERIGDTVTRVGIAAFKAEYERVKADEKELKPEDAGDSLKRHTHDGGSEKEAV
ncbi:nitrite and sulfite reductase 4Fe-4S region [Thermincola ferriacetica]|uniref:Nitrite and sulfite reductase 4Fe-4S region n=1 Tax=Thermincola ferriacetica TaxID=281456 RepID=A0A0L6W4W6_9FIRM|nr:4Fe-4S dicluster domain-containing protein [Thermincola ferriacetica]KNZ70575.1 nitrite and sulfite reductase 4Fe-4S region [Thermincola ferriacetica]